MDEEKPREALDGRRRSHEVDAETPGCAQEVARESRRLADGLEDKLPVGLHDHGEVLHQAEEGVGQRDLVGTAVVRLREEGSMDWIVIKFALSVNLTHLNTASTQQNKSKLPKSKVLFTQYIPDEVHPQTI